MIIEWLLGEVGGWVLSSLTDASIKYFKNRKRYLKEVTKSITSAKSDLLLCINTLTSREKNAQIKSLQDELAKQVNEGISVKIIVSRNKDSYTGAYELFQRGISIKFVPDEVSQHLNFTLIDKKASILSLKDKSGKSKSAILINDVALCQTLEKTFENIWDNPKTLSFNEFFLKKVNEVNEFGIIRPSDIAEKFSIPSDYFERLMLKFPIYIFLIGKPGAGKSTMAEKIKEYFRHLNFKENDIRYIDDYYILKDWSSKDIYKSNFEVIEYGGFKILNFDMYHNCNEEIIKQLSNGKPCINIIEFSRNVYNDFFKKLPNKIRDRSLTIYFDASISTCLIRNGARKFSSRNNSKYVPEDIIREHYSTDDIQVVIDEYRNVYKLSSETKDVSVDLFKLLNKTFI